MAAENNADQIAAFLVKSDRWRSLGKLDEAARCAEDALARLSTHTDDKLSSIALSKLAVVRMEQGKLPEAESLHREALAIVVKRSGIQSAEYAVEAGNLVSVLTAQAKYIQAERLILAAIEAGRATLGTKSRKYADLLGARAELLFKKGLNRKAINLIEEELNIRMNLQPLDKARLGQTYQNLAVVCGQTGKFAQALEAIQRAEEIWISSLPEESLSRLYLANTVLTLYDKTRQYEKANTLIPAILARAEKHFDIDHPELGVILNNIGTIYGHQNRHAEAAVFFKRAYQVDMRALGQFHPNTAHALLNYGTTLRKLGEDEAGRVLEVQARAVLDLVH